MLALLREVAQRASANPLVEKLLLALTESGASRPEAQPLAEPLPEPLTERELEVLNLLAADLSNKEIARKLTVSLNTVLYHNKNIYGKLGVNKRSLAIAKARELRLL